MKEAGPMSSLMLRKGPKPLTTLEKRAPGSRTQKEIVFYKRQEEQRRQPPGLRNSWV